MNTHNGCTLYSKQTTILFSHYNYIMFKGNRHHARINRNCLTTKSMPLIF